MSLPPNPHPIEVFRCARSSLSPEDKKRTGEYLEKPVSLVFRGTLRDLSIEGRVNHQRLTLQLIMSLPPNSHPVEVFRCAQVHILAEIHRCDKTRGLRQEAKTEWEVAKTRFKVAEGGLEKLQRNRGLE